MPLAVQQEEVAPVDDFCYLGSVMEYLKHRRVMAWGTLWKLETVWRSQSISLATKLKTI